MPSEKTGTAASVGDHMKAIPQFFPLPLYALFLRDIWFVLIKYTSITLAWNFL